MTDRPTDGHCHGIVRRLYKWAYEKQSYRLWWDAADQCSMSREFSIHNHDNESYTIQLEYTFETEQESMTVSYYPTRCHGHTNIFLIIRHIYSQYHWRFEQCLSSYNFVFIGKWHITVISNRISTGDAKARTLRRKPCHGNFLDQNEYSIVGERIKCGPN